MDMTTPLDVPSDGESIRASREDPIRFRAIFDRHVGAVYRYLYRRVGPDVVEELTADTFVIAFDLRERFEGENALPWLYGIAANVLRRHLRSASRRERAHSRAGSLFAVGSADDQIEDRLDAAAAAPQLAAALAQLEPRDREVLLLFAWEELSYQEISDALGIAPGTVASRLSRARRRMRERLGDTWQAGSEAQDG
jgi:RNA polymerase sigma-70 factor (ECF subfamily)